MRSMLPGLVLVLVSLLAAMLVRAVAGEVVAVALFLTMLLGGGMVLVVNRR